MNWVLKTLTLVSFVAASIPAARADDSLIVLVKAGRLKYCDIVKAEGYEQLYVHGLFKGNFRPGSRDLENAIQGYLNFGQCIMLKPWQQDDPSLSPAEFGEALKSQTSKDCYIQPADEYQQLYVLGTFVGNFNDVFSAAEAALAYEPCRSLREEGSGDDYLSLADQGRILDVWFTSKFKGSKMSLILSIHGSITRKMRLKGSEERGRAIRALETTLKNCVENGYCLINGYSLDQLKSSAESDLVSIDGLPAFLKEHSPNCYVEPMTTSRGDVYNRLIVKGFYVGDFLSSKQDAELVANAYHYPICSTHLDEYRSAGHSFSLSSLDRSLAWMTETLYSQKREFISAAMESVKKIPLSNEPTLESLDHLAGQLFILNAISPVVFGTDSEVFVTNIQPAYSTALQKLNQENGIKTLSDFEPTSSVVKVSLQLLSASLRASSMFVADEIGRRGIQDLLMAMGTALAKQSVNRQEIAPILTELERNHALLNKLTTNRRTQELGQVAQSMAEYLAGI